METRDPELYRQAAAEKYEVPDEVEVYHDGQVMFVIDGAWVQGWIWVADTDVEHDVPQG